MDLNIERTYKITLTAKEWAELGRVLQSYEDTLGLGDPSAPYELLQSFREFG